MTSPWPRTPPSLHDRASYAASTLGSFWLDGLPARDPAPVLRGTVRTQLCIVGGGFTGLWAALHAKAQEPGRDVVLVEGDRIGAAASGRNGGFLVASLTHGIGNGLDRFADEMETIERLSIENYDGLLADLRAHGIDCDLEPVGELVVALDDDAARELHEEAAQLREFGHDVVVFDAAGIQAEVHSQTYRGGLWDRTGAAIVNPGKLGEGLRAAAKRAGVRIFEHTRATALKQTAGGVTVTTEHGRVDAERVILASGSHKPLLPAIRRYVAPVYDYALMSEPLSAEQLESIGWSRRQGIGDAANQLQYYRLTTDNRILWGGYDAVYRYGGPVSPEYDDHDVTFAKLAQHFFTTFPQLRGLRFTHRWGGAIDTCSRFSVFFGTSHGGRVSYAAGYTGLGVCATRFGARVALDLVDGRTTEATRLRYVRERPVAFPPEPLRSLVIALTQNRLAAADEQGGKRGRWLRLLDRLGLGFSA